MEKLWASKTFSLIPKEEVADLALFLSAAIQLDTYNFKDYLKGHKWVPLDKEMFDKLVEACP